eukprot:TRINITY_DN14174_c0_g1_i1.p1 TRINITY_DN14174_c0_g1~~TRINITY_DN14174_c0_g1_i1.p1  ORF type:complete len:374 (+),score=56.65 TRINITY_DN14174_c0_g1_i1:56-1177(+)
MFQGLVSRTALFATLVLYSEVEGSKILGRTKEKYGFYIHGFAEDAALLYQVRALKKFFPTSPVYIMSDGGRDYSELCKEEGCTFQLCPPANDRWHPWPFFRRMHDAAQSLNTEYVIMLEPDNTIHGPITHEPEYDAAGVFVPQRGYGVVDYITSLGRKRNKDFVWNKTAWSAGLCGGSYYRTEALLDALADDKVTAIDWAKVASESGQHKEIFSSDLALVVALAARGYTTGPWADVAQMGDSKDKPVTGSMQSAFRHYCSCYPGGKPNYQLKLLEADRHLAGKEVKKFQGRGVTCQQCYDSDEYKKAWGSLQCTSKQPVHQKPSWSMHRQQMSMPMSLVGLRHDQEQDSVRKSAEQESLEAFDARMGCPRHSS